MIELFKLEYSALDLAARLKRLRYNNHVTFAWTTGKITFWYHE